MRATLLFCALAACAGCDRSGSKLRDLSWGRPVERDYAKIVERTRFVLQQHFHLGMDPDLTDEKKGDFWTVWIYRMATNYRDSKRIRAHVQVEDLGEGKVRVGVSVVTQLNDNIDNPDIKEEARWVDTTRDVDMAARLESQIVRRYRDLEPSEAWKEKHRDKPRGTMRPDLLDRNKDASMGENELDDPKKEMPGKDDR